MAAIMIVHGPCDQLWRRPLYLLSYDVDANGGMGREEFTAVKAEALRFPSKAAALAAWRSQSTVRPRRPDGKPNRPLTAYTVEIVDLEEP